MTEKLFEKNRNYFTLGQEKNRITFDGYFLIHNLRPVFAKIHDLVNKQGFKSLIFDFSRIVSTNPGAMLPLCSCVQKLIAFSRVEINIILPDDEIQKSIFIRSGWANIFEPRTYQKPQIKPGAKLIPAFSYSTPEEQDSTINEILEILLANIQNFERSAFASVEWAINEVTDNVLNHSQSEIGGLIQLWAFNPRKRLIEFTISDAGIGVPNTLRSNNPNLSDTDALMEAVKSGVTRNKSEFQGNGLYGTLEICRAGGGKFSLNSGHAALICQDGGINTKLEKVPFTGTCIDAHIDFSVPQLLEKALAIDGRVHKPVDYLELKYEQDDLKNIIFRLSDQGYSFRSRIAGKPIRTKIKNILQNCNGQIIHIDFYGISVVSSSFADEVFGKLFIEIGPMHFMKSIQFKNTSSTVQALIDRAILQRVQNPHSD